MTDSCLPSLAKFANNSRARARRFSLELNSWSVLHLDSSVEDKSVAAPNKLPNVLFALAPVRAGMEVLGLEHNLGSWIVTNAGVVRCDDVTRVQKRV